MIDDEQQIQASLYALGALPADEAAAFEAALRASPELAELVEEYRMASDFLVEDLGGRQPPPSLRRNILAAIRPDPLPAPAPTARIGTWFPWALAAGLAVFAGVLVVQLSSRRGALEDRILALTAELQSRDASLGAIERELASAEVAITELRRRNDLAEMKVATLTSQLDASYLASIAWDETAQEGILHVRRLPETERGKEYQLWVFDPKRAAPVSGGVFTVKPDGSAVIHFAPAQKVSEVTAFAVTLEKEGGVPKAEGPVVLSN